MNIGTGISWEAAPDGSDVHRSDRIDQSYLLFYYIFLLVRARVRAVQTLSSIARDIKKIMDFNVIESLTLKFRESGFRFNL